MNVLLIHPPSPFLTDSRVFPPLGILYLAAALEKYNFPVQVADLGLWPDSLTGYNPDLIGVTATTPQYPLLPDLLTRIHKIYRGVPVIMGGPHFSLHPDAGDRLGAEATGLGDCEDAIVAAARDVALGRRLKTRYFSPGWVVDPDLYPIPARHLLPIRSYKYRIDHRPATSAVTQRGCPYECVFCCHWQGYRRVRLRSVTSVVEEVRELKRMGFGAVMFYDDEFNLIPLRTEMLCEALKNEKIRWRAFIRTNLFAENQARYMAESGCHELCAGVESGSDDILERVNKRATVADATKARQLCREHGIRFKAFMIVGLPGETTQTVEATKRWLIENRPDDFDVTVYTDYTQDGAQHYKGRAGEYRGPWAETRDTIEQEVREEMRS